jgi:hypothetical protein
MEVFFTDIESFIFDLLGILSGASVLFYFVAPVFLKDKQDEDYDQPQKENNDEQ